MASPGEDNLQILGILSPEVRTQREDPVFLFWMGVYELLGGRFQESSEEPRERTSKGRVGSAPALGTGLGACEGSYLLPHILFPLLITFLRISLSGSKKNN